MNNITHREAVEALLETLAGLTDWVPNEWDEFVKDGYGTEDEQGKPMPLEEYIAEARMVVDRIRERLNGELDEIEKGLPEEKEFDFVAEDEL